MKALLKISLIGLALVSGVAGWAWQWQRASGRREALASMKRDLVEVRAENARLTRIVTTSSETEATRHVREEIERTRQEIAAWEQRLKRQPEPMPRQTPFTENRDPEKGPVRLEHFGARGNATPSAAFQTAVWAMTTGADDALPALFALSPAGRDKLRTFFAGMAPEVRRRYEPPEKLIGLLFARDILEEEGLEIGSATEPDSSGRVFLPVFRVRSGRKNPQEKKYPLIRGPAGWQIPISDQMVDGIPAALAQASMYVPPRVRTQ